MKFYKKEWFWATLAVLLIVSLLAFLIWNIYDDYYRFANEAKADLQKVDPDFYKMRSGYYDTSRQSGLVVWDRTDGTTCETRYVNKELVYPPISDCYFNSGPTSGYHKNGR